MLTPAKLIEKTDIIMGVTPSLIRKMQKINNLILHEK
jgi:hypothetical protein